jgi:hypothetical protein
LTLPPSPRFSPARQRRLLYLATAVGVIIAGIVVSAVLLRHGGIPVVWGLALGMTAVNLLGLIAHGILVERRHTGIRAHDRAIQREWAALLGAPASPGGER